MEKRPILYQLKGIITEIDKAILGEDGIPVEQCFKLMTKEQGLIKIKVCNYDQWIENLHPVGSFVTVDIHNDVKIEI
jgi:hypothetical protein